MDQFTLRIDPTTRDIIMDETGAFQTVAGDEAVAQNVRLTLDVWRGEFPFDPSHGTDYERIMGKKPGELEEDEVPEVIRDAILQEPGVAEVENVEYKFGEGRELEISAVERLNNGNTITTEVTKR